MKYKNYRHGDICLIGIEQLPNDLVKSDSNVLMVGRNNHPHSIDNGCIYFFDNEYIFGYLVAEKTTLYHHEHGRVVEGSDLRKADIEDGVYELRKQNEFINNELKPVID